MEARSQLLSAGCAPLAALPKDILCCILKKVGLKDRLRLELVDRSHRDTLRDHELWKEINLGAMQALDLSQKQLVCLLSRICPQLLKHLHRVKSMTETLRDISLEYKDHVPNALGRRVQWLKADWTYLRKDMIILARLYFPRCHQAIPESWGSTRLAVEACTRWFSEQVTRISRALTSFWQNFSVILKRLQGPFAIAKVPGSKLHRATQLISANAALALDVSGATSLSPPFLAACVIAMSAAGVKVDFKMDQDTDPLFPLHEVVNLLNILALDCSIKVNMLISDLYHFWKTNFLKDVNPWNRPSQGDQPDFSALEAFQINSAVSQLVPYGGSEASFKHCHQTVWTLLNHRLSIAAAAGRVDKWLKSETRLRVVASTVVFDSLYIIPEAQKMIFEGIREYLQESPSKLRLVFHNCLYIQPELRGLCTLLGDCGVGSLSFQLQAEFPLDERCNPQAQDAVLGSQALQKSKNLRVLELDCPLVLEDLDSAARFLDSNESGATLVLHLRPRSFANPETARLFLSKLHDLCASEHGARVKIVQHRGNSARHSGDDARATTGGASDAFLSPVQQEIRADLRLEKMLTWTTRLLWALSLLEALLALALIFDVKLFGYQLYPLTWFIGLNVVAAVHWSWRPIMATIRGKRDYVGVAIGLCIAGVVPYSVTGYAFKRFCAYMGACLIWTGARQLYKKIRGLRLLWKKKV